MQSKSLSRAVHIRNLCLLMLLLLPVSALGTRFGLWSFKIGLLLMVLCLAVGLIIELLNGVWLLLKPEPATKRVLQMGSLLSLPAVIILILSVSKPNGFVMIHNISTDRLDPPLFVAAVAQRGNNSNPLAYTAEVAQIQKQAYPGLSTLRSELSPRAAFQRAETIVNDLGWQVYAREPDAGRIEAVDTTFWFGFKDDIVIRIRPSENGGSLVDLRSVSRVGGGDTGTNARRIEKFLASFKLAGPTS